MFLIVYWIKSRHTLEMLQNTANSLTKKETEIHENVISHIDKKNRVENKFQKRLNFKLFYI